MALRTRLNPLVKERKKGKEREIFRRAAGHSSAQTKRGGERGGGGGGGGDSIGSLCNPRSGIINEEWGGKGGGGEEKRQGLHSPVVTPDEQLTGKRGEGGGGGGKGYRLFRPASPSGGGKEGN